MGDVIQFRRPAPKLKGALMKRDAFVEEIYSYITKHWDPVLREQVKLAMDRWVEDK